MVSMGVGVEDRVYFADAGGDAFFVVSGFLIAGSFERSHGVMSFYTRRIFRLVPMYVFVVLAQTIFIISWLPAGPFSAIHETLRYLICNLAFANFAQHDIAGLGQIGGVTWQGFLGDIEAMADDDGGVAAACGVAGRQGEIGGAAVVAAPEAHGA